LGDPCVRSTIFIAAPKNGFVTSGCWFGEEDYYFWGIISAATSQELCLCLYLGYTPHFVRVAFPFEAEPFRQPKAALIAYIVGEDPPKSNCELYFTLLFFSKWRLAALLVYLSQQHLPLFTWASKSPFWTRDLPTTCTPFLQRNCEKKNCPRSGPQTPPFLEIPILQGLFIINSSAPPFASFLPGCRTFFPIFFFGLVAESIPLVCWPSPPALVAPRPRGTSPN